MATQPYYADTGGDFGGLNEALKGWWTRGNRPPAPPRQSLYNYQDPLAQFTSMFGRYGGVNDLFDPTGRAYSDPIEQLLRGEAAGRARGASLRAKRSTIPGMGAFAQLQSDLGSASDLARGLGEARASGVEASQRFRSGLLGNIMNYGFQGERGERGYEQERQLQRERLAAERRIAKEGRQSSIQLPGGFGISF